MIYVAVDPFIMGSPLACKSAVELEAHIEALVGWAEASARPGIRMATSTALMSALIEAGQYPYRQALSEAISRLDVSTFDVETVSRIAEAFWRDELTLSSCTGVEDILLGETVSVSPDQYTHRLAAPVRPPFSAFMATLAASQAGLGGDSRPFRLATARSGKHSLGPMSVTCVVHAIQAASDIQIVDCTPPVDVEETFPAHTSLDELLQDLGALFHWSDATSEEGALDAIAARVAELQRSTGTKVRPKPFALGRNFLSSARQWGFGVRSDLAFNLIDTCARILLGIPKNPCKPFWTKPGSRIQRARADRAKAFRTHLTKRHEGFRLMYWANPDGKIEFANVGDKDELLVLD